MRSQYHPYIQRIKLLGVGLILSALVLSACQAAPASPVVTTSNPPAASATTTPILPATGPTAAPPTAEPTMAPTAAPASGPSISVATDPEYGQILVGDGGFTLYMFTKDEPDKSNCNASCLEKWPPLQTHGSPKLGSGVDASLIGTTTLADGTQIVTYNHMPLYYWYHDAKAGDTNGQGVGEVWFVVSPAGQPVKKESSTPAAASGAPAAAAGPSIGVATNPEYGQYLVGDKGMALYVFTKDGPDQSNCSGACAQKWPPLLTQGAPALGDGVDASMIGTASLADGTKIVTYNHMPLYYWYQDAKAGDTNGQGVGEVWFLVSPAGQPVKEESSTPAAASGAPAAAAGPSIGVASDAKHGQFLVGDNGKTLYVFTKDGPDQSNCSGACAQKWPPLLTQGAPALGSGVDASMIGTATLADGTKIVTYNHMPLYYWYQDAKPGDTNGEGVGQVWFMLSPTGKMIQLPVVQPAPTKKPKTGGMGGKNY